MKRIINTFPLILTLSAMLAIPAMATPQDTPHQEAAVLNEEISFRKGEYKGFKFEVPELTEISEADGQYVGKMPDGSFGISLSVLPARGSDRQRALGLCRSSAKNLKVDNVSSRFVKINGMDGAIATGALEDHRVTILVLPHKGKELTAVIINAPDRESWSARFIKTLSH